MSDSPPEEPVRQTSSRPWLVVAMLLLVLGLVTGGLLMALTPAKGTWRATGVVEPYGVLYTGQLLYKLGTFLLLLGLGVWAVWRWRDLPTLTWVRLNMALGFAIVAIGGALSYLHISIHSRPGF